MKTLLIGSGGREHALAIALAADPAVTALTCAPGNPGMALLHTTDGAPVEIRPVAETDPAAVAALAVELGADLVVVGPEAPLVAGVADAVRAKGIAVFGPSAAAARLEGSKAFAKDVMYAAGVPTGGSATCADRAEVEAALHRFGAPHVVKDDGLAAGKGVVVTGDRDVALAHADAVLAGGHRVVVEEYLAGPEVSVFAVTDGVTAVPLWPAQDFKRLGDGDTGLNTGGMGAYTPLDWAPAALVDDVMASVVEPTLAEMRSRGARFEGLLYVGLAITAQGPKVIEFNCRFGDPETQVVLPMLVTPLGGVLRAAATGTLGALPALRWRDGAAVTVVIASAGYPVEPRKGDVITGAEVNGVVHAGTARRDDDGALLSAGGRVVCAVGTGSSLTAARAAAYDLVDSIGLADSQHRRDIAADAIAGRVRVPSE
jgi:phosphoribosylamine--glycine ligase